MTSGGSHDGRHPELDGLRGIAIGLVLTCHWLGMRGDVLRYTAVGSAGVTVFFTLSGYLITRQLLTERSATGTVSLAAFYGRRVRRLAPALIAVVAVVVAVEVVAGAHLAPLRPTLLLYANWKPASGISLGVLNPTWSLSIEEQFYLVWPVVLLVALRHRRLAVWVTLAGIACSTALRFVLAIDRHDSLRAYYGTDTQASSLLVGCLLALLVAGGLRPLRVPGPVLLAASLSLFAWVLVPDPAVGRDLVPIVVAWVTAGLIWAAIGAPGGGLAGRPLRYLGRRSYGIYLWHYLFVMGAATATGGSRVWCFVAVLVSLGVAEVSWRMVERPFLTGRAQARLVLLGRRCGEVGVAVATTVGRARPGVLIAPRVEVAPVGIVPERDA